MDSAFGELIKKRDKLVKSIQIIKSYFDLVTLQKYSIIITALPTLKASLTDIVGKSNAIIHLASRFDLPEARTIADNAEKETAKFIDDISNVIDRIELKKNVRTIGRLIDAPNSPFNALPLELNMMISKFGTFSNSIHEHTKNGIVLNELEKAMSYSG